MLCVLEKFLFCFLFPGTFFFLSFPSHAELGPRGRAASPWSTALRTGRAVFSLLLRVVLVLVVAVSACAFTKAPGSSRLEGRNYQEPEAQESGPKRGLYRVCAGANTRPHAAVVSVTGLELQGLASPQATTARVPLERGREGLSRTGSGQCHCRVAASSCKCQRAPETGPRWRGRRLDTRCL